MWGILAATAVCLPPPGRGACLATGSPVGLVVVALLVAGIAGLCAAAGLMLNRYLTGERDLSALVARPLQALVSTSVLALIALTLTALALGPR